MRKLTLFILLYLIWCGLTFFPTPFDLALGAGVCIMIAALFGDILYVDYAIFLNPKRFVYLAHFLVVFAYYSVKANIEVALRVLSPRLKIRPGIVKIRTALKKDSSKAILANAITLIPGTLTVDAIDGYMYIHWLNVGSTDINAATKMISHGLEKIIKEAFE